MTAPSIAASARIPASHRDLADCPPVAALTTTGSDGYPQTSVVWCDADGDCVRVNTMRGFAKERNMRRDPRVTLLCFDPRRPLRSLEIRGTVVEMTEDGAREHLDALASRYAGRPIAYFGDAIPASFADREVPVVCRILPRRVVALDAAASRASVAMPRVVVPPVARPLVAESPLAQPPVTRPIRPIVARRLVAAPRVARPLVAIPASHADLLTGSACGVLTTLDAQGRPESSLVWVDLDDGCAAINTTLERRKGRNLLADPRATLLVVDPSNTARFLQVRGDAELDPTGAVEHLDRLTRRYTRHQRFYGGVYPEAQAERETRVIVRIRARRVTLDAIHA